MPYVQRGDARIFWDAGGSGEPVLLIMGLGYPSEMWYRLLPALVDRYRAIYVDNRGVGRTGVPPGPYDIETMADDAACVIEEAGEHSAHVVGASMGGIIAQELALRHPERVRSLLLACTLPGGKETAPASSEALSLLTSRGEMTPREAAEAAVPFVYAPDTDRALIDEDIELRMKNPTEPRGYVNQILAIQSHMGTYSRLGEISVPTLVIHGTADRLVNPDNARILAGRIPGASLEYIEGASHILFTDRTAQARKLVRAFLDDVSNAS